MKLRELLREIDHDDSVYSKEASSKVVNFPLKAADGWKHLMNVDQYEVLWRQKTIAKEYFQIVLKADDRPGILLEVKIKVVKVPGGSLHGVFPDSLSSHEKLRGTGLALKLYNALIEHGQVLFSSTAQTTGSRKLWEQLVNIHKSSAFVLATESAARWYINKDKEYEHRNAPNVLLTGPLNKLNDEAYASEETRWVIVPGNVDILKKEAINL